jgi:hypothetical protein
VQTAQVENIAAIPYLDPPGLLTYLLSCACRTVSAPAMTPSTTAAGRRPHSTAREPLIYSCTCILGLKCAASSLQILAIEQLLPAICALNLHISDSNLLRPE